MNASPRQRRTGASVLAVIGLFALLAAFFPGVANAQQGGGNPDVCWNVDGFERDLKGSISEDWGSATWTPSGGSDGIVTIDVNDGYEVEVCLKKGPNTYVVGPFGSDVGAGFQVNPPASAPGSPDDGVSHYDVRVVSTPPEIDEPADAFVRVTAMCVDEAAGEYRIRVRHEGGHLPVNYNLQIGDTVLTSGALTETGDENASYHWLPVGSDGVKAIPADDEWVNTYDGTASTSQNPCEGVLGEEEENEENGNGEENGSGEENGEEGAVAGIGEEAPTTTEGDTAVAGETVTPGQAAAPATLPRTGLGSGLLAGMGVASLLAGLGLTRTGRRAELV